jgi:hypothetical protein
MARYTVNSKSFVGNAIREEGEVIEYEGIPGPNLTPLDDAAQAEADAAAADAVALKADQVARQQAAAQTGDPGNAVPQAGLI